MTALNARQSLAASPRCCANARPRASSRSVIQDELKAAAKEVCDLDAFYAGQSTRERERILLNMLGGQRPVLVPSNLGDDRRPSSEAWRRLDGLPAGAYPLVEDIEELGPDTKINQAMVREIKTRGREIVDAWDSYQADHDRAKEAVDLPAIRRRGKEINERRIRLWSQIATTPARTVDGMHAKIAFASIFNSDEREDLVGGTVDDLLLSAAMDYADIHGQDART
jgi:hypothetical protein